MRYHPVAARITFPLKGVYVLGLLAFSSLLFGQGKGYTDVDSPGFQQTYTGYQVFGGWAMNSSKPVASVAIRIDGASYGNASYGGNRQDACNAIGNYPGCPYVGYSFGFDTSHLQNGSHTLVITATTTDSQQTSQTVLFSTSNTGSFYVDIDTPVSQATYSGGVGLGGWTMDRSDKVSTVQVSIDGTSYGDASYGGNRQDACNAIGNYPGCPYVGWNFYLNTAQLANGSHSVTITSTTTDGRQTSNSQTFITVNGAFAAHQAYYEPYGIDQYGVGTDATRMQQANVQWVRILVPWFTLEPNAPVGEAHTNVNGQTSGQHTYNWSFIDAQVNDAVSRGINIYLNIYWVPAWANGNPYPSCDPVLASTQGQCYVNGVAVGNPQGYLPLNTGYLQDFAYALAQHYNGLASYYGPLNEPNFVSNFNPYQQGLNNPSGEYLAYYVTYFERPTRAGIKAANANNRLVGPDVSLDHGSVPCNNCGLNGWIYPLNEYFSSEFDVWSVHNYADSGTVIGNMDQVNSLTNSSHPVWLTEFGYGVGNSQSTQAAEVQEVYVGEYNRSNWWIKTFYHTMWDNSNATSSDALLNADFSPRQAYTTYQSLYGHQ